MSLFWVTRMAFSTFSSISGRPAYMATTGASLVTPSIWQSVSQPWKHIHAQRDYNNPNSPGEVFVHLRFEIFTGFFLASVHIPHESFQAPISPGAIDGEDGFWTLRYKWILCYLTVFHLWHRQNKRIMTKVKKKKQAGEDKRHFPQPSIKGFCRWSSFRCLLSHGGYHCPWWWHSSAYVIPRHKSRPAVNCARQCTVPLCWLTAALYLYDILTVNIQTLDTDWEQGSLSVWNIFMERVFPIGYEGKTLCTVLSESNRGSHILSVLFSWWLICLGITLLTVAQNRYSTSFLPVRVIERQVVHCSWAKELVDALGQVFHVHIWQHIENNHVTHVSLMI